jgi:hypothetical protein
MKTCTVFIWRYYLPRHSLFSTVIQKKLPHIEGDTVAIEATSMTEQF